MALPLRTKANRWQDRIAHRLARKGASHARPHIPSKTLRNALRVVSGDNPGDASVFLPHYWAVFLHDGRGPIRMPQGKYLVWFRDPNNDPRRPGGTSPERLRDFRRLTPAEFRYWSRQNRLADSLGQPRPMIIAQAVKGVDGSFFFDNDKGMSGFVSLARRILREEFEKFVIAELRAVSKSITVEVYV